MSTSGSQPFTAATSPFAYAQAFTGQTSRRPSAHRFGERLTRTLSALRPSRHA